MIRLWLDDERDPRNFCADPSVWTWVKTVEEAIELLATGQVVEASLDNDLGKREDGSLHTIGRKTVEWMAAHDVWPPEGITIHSQNSVETERMCQDIAHYGPYARRIGYSRRFRPAR